MSQKAKSKEKGCHSRESGNPGKKESDAREGKMMNSRGHSFHFNESKLAVHWLAAQVGEVVLLPVPALWSIERKAWLRSISGVPTSLFISQAQLGKLGAMIDKSKASAVKALPK